MLPFKAPQGKKKLSQLLLLHNTQLIGLDPLPNDKSKAKVVLAVPITHQQVGNRMHAIRRRVRVLSGGPQVLVDRTNDCALHATIRSGPMPHSSAVMIKGTPPRPMWSLTFFFTEQSLCETAHSHLTQTRALVRQQLVRELIGMLPVPPLPESPPDSPRGNAPAVPPRNHARHSQTDVSAEAVPASATPTDDAEPNEPQDQAAPAASEDQATTPTDAETSGEGTI